MGHAALRLWRHKTVWVVEGVGVGAAGAGGEQSASWRVVAVDSSAVESPFMGEKTAAIIVYANCLKYPGLRPPSPSFLPSPTSFRGRRFVKTFRDSSTTAGDGDVDVHEWNPRERANPFPRFSRTIVKFDRLER